MLETQVCYQPSVNATVGQQKLERDLHHMLGDC